VTRTIESAIIPDNRNSHGPVGVFFWKVAVDQNSQGRDSASALLLRAIRQTEQAAREMGIYALVLYALDEDARTWYQSLNFGFEALLDDPNHLFLPLSAFVSWGFRDTRSILMT